MKDFVAIDLETANRFRHSICQIGITEVINGIPQEPKSWLVQPPENWYEPFNKHLHGINEKMTENKPLFPEVWAEVAPLLEGKIVVAHNVSFDMYALCAAFWLYAMPLPTFDVFCSLRLSRMVFPGIYSYSLDVVLNHLGLDIEHYHSADDDSLGCANVFLRCLEESGCEIEDLEEKFGFTRGHFSNDEYVSVLAKRKQSSWLDVKAITGDPEKVDENNYFYGKSVCFTGACQFGVRRDLLQMIADIGGIPSNSVTKTTDVLVVGQQDYRVVGEDGMSNKQEKALDLLAKGHDIEILSEAEFMERF